MVVVFPAPFGPSRPKTSPVRISKVIPRSAWTEPYDFASSRTLTAFTLANLAGRARSLPPLWRERPEFVRLARSRFRVADQVDLHRQGRIGARAGPGNPV